jgi:hypothetical protein
MDLWHAEHALQCTHLTSLALARLQSTGRESDCSPADFDAVAIAVESLRNWLECMELAGLESFKDALHTVVQDLAGGIAPAAAVACIRAPLDLLQRAEGRRELAASSHCRDVFEAFARAFEGQEDDYSMRFDAHRLLEACGGPPEIL